MDSLQHIEIDEEVQNKIQNNLNNVKVQINTENKFPFGFTARLYFASDSTKVWSEPDLVIDSLTIEPATIDTINGVSGDPTPGVLHIELNNENGDLMSLQILMSMLEQSLISSEQMVMLLLVWVPIT